MKSLSKSMFILIVLVFLMIAVVVPIYSQDDPLGTPLGEPFKVGVLGVMSGSSASWGLVCKYCAEANAKLINDEGGFVVDGVRHKIEVISVDEKLDPKLAVQGAERLIFEEKVKYIIGTNVDPTTAAILPVLEANKVLAFPYAMNKEIFRAPHNNTVLSMVSSFQSVPIICKYLIDNYGVKTVSFITKNQADSLNQRLEAIAAVEKLGLKIISSDVTYEPETSDFFPILTKVLKEKSDLLILPAVSTGDAPLIIKSIRQLGYKGFICADNSQDVKTLVEGAGKDAEGFIYVGGGSTPEIRSEYMNKFIETYKAIAGEWNDEAGTKVYALPVIIYTIQQAGKAALTDIESFKAAMPYMKVDDPFIKGEYSRILEYVGKSYFGQNHQIGVPLVITQIKNGEAATLFVGTVVD
jgi:branched-chain amino acid transport system substrate-binding protein